MWERECVVRCGRGVVWVWVSGVGAIWSVACCREKMQGVTPVEWFHSFEFEKIDLRVELPHTHPHTPHTPITRTHDTHTGVTSPILVRHNTYLQNSASIRLGCFDTSSAHRIAEILLRNSALDLQDTIAEAQFHASLRLD